MPGRCGWGTFGCLIGGLVVSLVVTRPLTAGLLVDGALEGATWLLFATVGLVLTLRRPGNPIGWLYAPGRRWFTHTMQPTQASLWLRRAPYGRTHLR